MLLPQSTMKLGFFSTANGSLFDFQNIVDPDTKVNEKISKAMTSDHNKLSQRLVENEALCILVAEGYREEDIIFSSDLKCSICVSTEMMLL